MNQISHIVVDYREKSSGVPLLLGQSGVKISFENLTVGDYILSRKHALERKTAQDFVSSLISGRLFDQVIRMREVYERPILVVEGEFNDQLEEFHNPKALWGALASISLTYDAKVFFTKDANQTAMLIASLAKHSMIRRSGGPVIQARPRFASEEEMQLAIVASLPGVGPKTADKLLRKFGTIRRVFSADSRTLALVPRLGEAKAAKISELLDKRYRAFIHDSKAQFYLNNLADNKA